MPLFPYPCAAQMLLSFGLPGWHLPFLTVSRGFCVKGTGHVVGASLMFPWPRSKLCDPGSLCSCLLEPGRAQTCGGEGKFPSPGTSCPTCCTLLYLAGWVPLLPPPQHQTSPDLHTMWSGAQTLSRDRLIPAVPWASESPLLRWGTCRTVLPCSRPGAFSAPLPVPVPGRVPVGFPCNIPPLFEPPPEESGIPDGPVWAAGFCG